MDENTWIVLDGCGRPLPSGGLADALVTDLDHQPWFAHKPVLRDGSVRLPAPDEPYAVGIRIPVDGFGTVWVWTDGEGSGCGRRSAPRDFLAEAAASRLAVVDRLVTVWTAEGGGPSLTALCRLDAARDLLAEARRCASPEASARLAMPALAAVLHAGEMVVLERARQRIVAGGGRADLRFGAQAFFHQGDDEPASRRFAAAMDLATLPFYRGMTEKVEGSPDFSRAEAILGWCERQGLAAKGHPLVWCHRRALPAWLLERGAAALADASRRYIATAVGRFRGRITDWDVINEAHDWANAFALTPEQLVDLTRLACDETRQADPAALRVVNSCCTWSEFVANGRNDQGPAGRPQRGVLSYLRDVISAGIGFEAVGMQMYYPAQDLCEIDRQIQAFCDLGKPVRITELGVSASEESVDTAGPGCLRLSPHRWHGRPWSQTEQADWLEGFYTLCASRPQVQAISWWDFRDPGFVPHDGLLDAASRPRESYFRLQSLRRAWGLPARG